MKSVDNVYVVQASAPMYSNCDFHRVCFMHAVRCAIVGFNVAHTSRDGDDTDFFLCPLCEGKLRLQGVI